METPANAEYIRRQHPANDRRHRKPIQLRKGVFTAKLIAMRKVLFLGVFLFFTCAGVWAQSAGNSSSRGQSPDDQAFGQQESHGEDFGNQDAGRQIAPQDGPAKGNAQAGVSSSKNTQVDLSPPPDDAKDHPDSAAAVSEAEEESGVNDSPVEEFHPFNPHKAMKDIEVGDFYFRQKNYKAALSRYQEALLYKPNDAVANFRSAQCFEELNSPQDAVEHYQAYLKVMPHGPFSRDAEKALAKLQGGPASAPPKSQ